jgi:rsbT co-antagonist protein RsbR
MTRCALSQHGADGTFVAASPTARAVYGISPEEIVGRRLQDLLDPDDTPDVDRALAAATVSTDAVLFVARLRGQGEAPRRIEVILHAKSDNAGEVQLVCIARDAAVGARAVAEQVQMSTRADQLGRSLERLIASVPGIVWEGWFVEDPSRQRVSFVSERVLAVSGYSPQEWLSDPAFWVKVTHPDDLEQAIASNHRVREAGAGTTQSRWITKDGRVIWIETQIQILRDDDGSPAGMCGVTMDITARKQAEEEQARLREEFIRSQATMLAELSTPLIPLGDGVLAMPLIGSIDSGRAERVMDTLLHGISASSARFAILDITGVPTVDTRVADTLLKAARGAQLLGAQVVLTGIRAEVARTLATLEADLTGLVICGTLQDGIRYAARGR